MDGLKPTNRAQGRSYPPRPKVRRKKNLGAGVGFGFPSSSRLNNLVTPGKPVSPSLGQPLTKQHSTHQAFGREVVHSRRSKIGRYTVRRWAPLSVRLSPGSEAPDQELVRTGSLATLGFGRCSQRGDFALPPPAAASRTPLVGGPGPGKDEHSGACASEGGGTERGRRPATARCIPLSPRLELSRTWAWGGGGGSLLALLSSNSVPLLTRCTTWGRSPRFPVSEAVGLACAEGAARPH